MSNNAYRVTVDIGDDRWRQYLAFAPDHATAEAMILDHVLDLISVEALDDVDEFRGQDFDDTFRAVEGDVYARVVSGAAS
jgi:hypothetical protein